MFIMKKLQICLNQSINFHYFSNIIKKYFTEDFWIDKITLYDLILKLIFIYKQCFNEYSLIKL